MATYTVTTSFSANTTAIASEVNQNFTDVLTALNALDAANLTGTIALARISNLTSSQMAAAFFKDEDDMASDSATAVSSQQASKAYSDTKESTIVTQSTAGLFGSWANIDSLSATLVKDEVYKVGSDGFVVAVGLYNRVIKGYTDGSNPPVAQRCDNFGYANAGQQPNFTMPVRKDDYWKVTQSGAGAIESLYWLPFGTGTCVKK